MIRDILVKVGERIFYGFGFGIGMGMAWRLVPTERRKINKEIKKESSYRDLNPDYRIQSPAS